uniref:Arginine repressor n=1 Tax=Vespula pensylvanica TaxID=30213 RepID=A0A834N2L8_VESPE|nr:hypothetical protein H0235_017050 [Vespula pensylvanica]
MKSSISNHGKENFIRQGARYHRLAQERLVVRAVGIEKTGLGISTSEGGRQIWTTACRTVYSRSSGSRRSRKETSDQTRSVAVPYASFVLAAASEEILRSTAIAFAKTRSSSGNVIGIMATDDSVVMAVPPSEKLSSFLVSQIITRLNSP